MVLLWGNFPQNAVTGRYSFVSSFDLCELCTRMLLVNLLYMINCNSWQEKANIAIQCNFVVFCLSIFLDEGDGNECTQGAPKNLTMSNTINGTSSGLSTQLTKMVLTSVKAKRRRL